MKQQQIILSILGLAILGSLFFFGKTVLDKPHVEAVSPTGNKATPTFNIEEFLLSAKQHLTLNQAKEVAEMEQSISRGDINNQQVRVYNQLANFWIDSAHQPNLYIYYLSKASKLENSEKNLTFAARFTLDNLRGEPDPAKRSWKAKEAIELFEKAIELNPTNDSLKVGLGSCYIFGRGMAGDPQETMTGIQQLLQVVRKDSTNMQAQLALGIGGVISKQYDKAIDRLLKVVTQEPDNKEAVLWLADAYASTGNKVEAVKWYQVVKKLVNNADFNQEVDERIKLLK